MRTGNPTLSKNTFSKVSAHGHDTMTLNGTVNKTIILLVLLLFPASYTWMKVFEGNSSYISLYLWGGLIGGLILALITIFKKEWSPFTAPFYAIFEGLFLGGLSAIFEKMYPGIVIQAVALTFGTLLMLLFAYKTRLIRATENFKLGVVAATGGIALIYFVSIMLSFFGISMPFIHESGLIGIGFSVFVVIIAALNLVLDFDFIEHGAEHGAPKYMEWYGAFGLMVTLIWLYIEILRLLAKLRSRN